MNIDRRKKNARWRVYKEDGTRYEPATYIASILAVLMDIRDELQLLNASSRTISRKIPPRPKKAKP